MTTETALMMLKMLKLVFTDILKLVFTDRLEVVFTDTRLYVVSLCPQTQGTQVF